MARKIKSTLYPGEPGAERFARMAWYARRMDLAKYRIQMCIAFILIIFTCVIGFHPPEGGVFYRTAATVCFFFYIWLCAGCPLPSFFRRKEPRTWHRRLPGPTATRDSAVGRLPPTNPRSKTLT